MQSFFTANFFKTNRQNLRANIENELIVITANGLLQRGGDSSFLFAQDASFWYLTGLDEPDLVLVMDGTTEYLIVPGRSDSREAFDGAINYEVLQKLSGIEEFLDEKSGWARLSEYLKKNTRVATIPPAPEYIEHYGLYANPARAALVRLLTTYNERLEIDEIGTQLARMRMVKQAPELQALRAAIDTTLRTIDEVSQPVLLKAYKHEYEIEADITRSFRRSGATGHAFDPIVAGGASAVTLHNVANNAPLNKQDLLVMDIGAEVEHYAADITRTISLSQPTKRQREVHDAVYDVQQHAMSLLKPGVLLREYEQKVADYMGIKLQALGLIETNNHDSVRSFFPHATSHFLGLNVHDVGDYDQPLAPGMVLTVEPGIYIADEAIGVRIEDDVLITETGITVLSKACAGKLA